MREQTEMMYRQLGRQQGWRMVWNSGTKLSWGTLTPLKLGLIGWNFLTLLSLSQRQQPALCPLGKGIAVKVGKALAISEMFCHIPYSQRQVILHSRNQVRTSLMVQWLRIHQPMLGT